MTYVLILLIYLTSGDIRKAEVPVPDATTCWQMAKDFVDQDPSKFDAKGLQAGCGAFDNTTRS